MVHGFLSEFQAQHFITNNKIISFKITITSALLYFITYALWIILKFLRRVQLQHQGTSPHTNCFCFFTLNLRVLAIYIATHIPDSDCCNIVRAMRIHSILFNILAYKITFLVITFIALLLAMTLKNLFSYIKSNTASIHSNSQ